MARQSTEIGDDVPDIRLLLFVSSQCPHCPKAEYLVKKIAPEYYDKGLSYEKVRLKTPEGKQYSEKYNVMSTPTALFINQDGSEINRLVGVTSENELRDKIESNLGVKKSFFAKLFGK